MTCLDELISIWFNHWTFYGCIFPPQKPNQFGNEYRTISCGLKGIIFYLEMVKGKYDPPDIKCKKGAKKGGGGVHNTFSSDLCACYTPTEG